jgi:hypothetical protein
LFLLSRNCNDIILFINRVHISGRRFWCAV